MYTFDSRIRYSEVGSDSKLTLLSLLDYFQDCSTFQSEDLGVGVEYLLQHHIVWVMSFWQIDISRFADLCEHVTIETFPYDFKLSLGFRNFSMKGGDGQRIAVANTLWTLLDTETGRPVRPPAEMMEKYVMQPRLDMEYLSRKIQFSGMGEQGSPVEVKKHHLDTNMHVNNGQYVAVACDFLPQDFKVKRMRATYHRQAYLGNVFYPVIYTMPGGITGIALNGADGQPYAKVEFTGE